MSSPQEQYDEAMLDYSMGEYDRAAEALRQIVQKDPSHFEAQLALGMTYYRKGDFAAAIAEGHKAEKLRPKEQLVHTNLSLFYMKLGNKAVAEHHGLQARIASWRDDKSDPADKPKTDPELEMARPKPAAPDKFPEMPWKKKAPGGQAH